jgi:hypothetical protein
LKTSPITAQLVPGSTTVFTRARKSLTFTTKGLKDAMKKIPYKGKAFVGWSSFGEDPHVGAFVLGELVIGA